MLQYRFCHGVILPFDVLYMYMVAEAFVASGTGAIQLLVVYNCLAMAWVPRTLARACCPGVGTRGAGLLPSAVPRSGAVPQWLQTHNPASDTHGAAGGVHLPEWVHADESQHSAAG